MPHVAIQQSKNLDTVIAVGLVAAGAAVLYVVFKTTKLVGDAGDVAQRTIGGAGDVVQRTLGGAGDVIQRTIGGAGDVTQRTIGGAGNVVATSVGGAGQNFNNLVGGVGQKVNDVWGGAGQLYHDAPQRIAGGIHFVGAAASQAGGTLYEQSGAGALGQKFHDIFGY